MPHGGPDWGTEGPLKTVYTVQDLGELAARLGSLDTFDRRGNVIFIDDFESTLNKWHVLYTAGVAKAEITAKYAHSGCFSALLKTDSGSGKIQCIRHSMPYPVLSKLGFEFSFSIGENIDYFILDAELNDDTYRYQPVIMLYTQSTKGKYRDKNGEWQNLPQITHIGLASYAFNTCKLVVDYPNKKYARLIVNNVSMDLSSITLQTGGYVPIPDIQLELKITNEGIDPGIAYIDDVIITQNEP